MGDSEELTRLRAKLAAREGKAGYKVNCEEIRKRIAELEAAETPPSDA